MYLLNDVLFNSHCTKPGASQYRRQFQDLLCAGSLERWLLIVCIYRWGRAEDVMERLREAAGHRFLMDFE